MYLCTDIHMAYISLFAWCVWCAARSLLCSPLPAALDLTSFTKCLYKETCKLVQVPGWLHCAKRMLTLCTQAN